MTSCPELSAHVDDAVKALRAYLVHRSEGADGPANDTVTSAVEALDEQGFVCESAAAQKVSTFMRGTDRNVGGPE